MADPCRTPALPGVFPARVVVVAVLLALSACSDRPTVAECTESFRNFVRLNTGSILSEAELDRMTREALTQEMAEEVCVNKKSGAQVRCEIAAESLAARRACEPAAEPH